MEKIIAACGLNCAQCEARIATLADDNDLRAKTAEIWKVQFNAPDIPIAAINCTGCMEPGVKLSHCSDCKIRNCVIGKGFTTCAECGLLDSCELVKMVHQYDASAMENLKSLN
ncbi:MAG: DUF3795 domain-containing protein [Bacteroidales bacterium]|jgi:hypothetical protein|nr:DUF3795 domain-containing protein [Bacteroidales bacterium]